MMDKFLNILIIFVILELSTCEITVTTLNVNGDENSTHLETFKQNDKNINKNNKSEELPLVKITDELDALNIKNEQSPLARSSRKVLLNPSCACQANQKHALCHLFKNKKLNSITSFIKTMSNIVKGFLFEIQNVLNWWDIIVQKMKVKMIKYKNLALMKKIKGICVKLPSFKNKIFQLMSFFFEMFNLKKYSKVNLVKGVNYNIKSTLDKIKSCVTSFIFMLQTLKLMGAASNNKLQAIQHFFNGIRSDQYETLDLELNKQLYPDIDANYGGNVEFKSGLNALANQYNIFQSIWNYMRRLPTIFTSISEILGELLVKMNVQSTLCKPNSSSRLPLSNLYQLSPQGYQLGVNENLSRYSSGAYRLPIVINKKSLMSFFKTDQFVIGDIVILNLSDVILVGTVNEDCGIVFRAIN